MILTTPLLGVICHVQACLDWHLPGSVCLPNHFLEAGKATLNVEHWGGLG